MHLPITSSTPARARVCRGVPSAISVHHVCAIGVLPIPCRLLDVIGDQSLESFTPSDLPDRAEGTLRTKQFGEDMADAERVAPSARLWNEDRLEMASISKSAG